MPPAKGVVIDLSGAHRLLDASQYERWYGFTHPRPGELQGWHYGFPELAAPQGRLIANPGCYATAALLALYPIRDAIDPQNVVVDAKSGMTGAGRSLKASSHAGFVLENVSPYKVGAHQHVPEIAQALGFTVSLTPHLLPLRRGLMATCYVRSTGPDLRALLVSHYASSHVVTVLPEGVAPELARVQNTDGAEIAVYQDSFTDQTIVVLRSTTSARAQPARRSRTPTCSSASTRPRAPSFRSPGMTSPPRRDSSRRPSRGHPAVGKSDLAVVRSTVPAVGAGMFSRNKVQAACLLVTASTSPSPSRRRS